MAENESSPASSYFKSAPVSLRIAFLISIGVFLLIAWPVLCVLFLTFPPFYNRHYNRIKDRLGALPNVQVIDSWRHEDITLEDFGFTLQVADEPPFMLCFWESANDDWYRIFGPIDGLTVRPELYAGDEALHVSVEEFAQNGIIVHDLNSTVQNFSRVLELLKDEGQDVASAPPSEGKYYLEVFEVPFR